MSTCPIPDDSSLPKRKADVLALIEKLNKKKGIDIPDAGTLTDLLNNIQAARDKWNQDDADATVSAAGAKDGKSTKKVFEAAALELTKATALPAPFELTNPRFLKEVDYYAAFFESLPLAELHLRTSFNTQGELLIARCCCAYERAGWFSWSRGLRPWWRTRSWFPWSTILVALG
jgi:hypothetical protein